MKRQTVHRRLTQTPYKSSSFLWHNLAFFADSSLTFAYRLDNRVFVDHEAFSEKTGLGAGWLLLREEENDLWRCLWDLSRPVLDECLITTVRLCVAREDKCNIVLKRHCYACRFAFLMVRHCVNLVKGVNDAFPAPISRDYRRGDIEGHMAELILRWCNNSPPLKGRLPMTFPLFTSVRVIMPFSTLTRNCAGSGVRESA